MPDAEQDRRYARYELIGCVRALRDNGHLDGLPVLLLAYVDDLLTRAGVPSSGG